MSVMNKRILYVGHYRENSGWGEASRNYILAMDRAGLDVVCRPVIFNGNAQIPDRIKELEKKEGEKPSINIQHVLPHLMCYDGSYEKNIGMFVSETYGIKNTSWFNKLKMMDQIWIPARGMIDEEAGFPYYKVRVVPHAFDVDEYDRRHGTIDFGDENPNYKFYYIGELNRRKNVISLLKAFHIEFGRHEPVSLVLKVYRPGHSPAQTKEALDKITSDIKSALGIYKDMSHYKSEIFIGDTLSRKDMLALHNSCDCFVNPSFGEAWGMPLFDAYAMKKAVVSSNNAGPLEYINDGNRMYGCISVDRGYAVLPEELEPISCSDKVFDDFGSARFEEWSRPNINCLRYYMRAMYNNGKKWYGDRDVSKYSLLSIGNKIKETLNEQPRGNNSKF